MGKPVQTAHSCHALTTALYRPGHHNFPYLVSGRVGWHEGAETVTTKDNTASRKGGDRSLNFRIAGEKVFLLETQEATLSRWDPLFPP